MGAMAVHVILYRDEGQVVAHCLEFDLVAQGTTSDEAYRNLLDAIELQADFTQATGDPENLIQLAPVEYWPKTHYNGWRQERMLGAAWRGFCSIRSFLNLL